MPDAFDNLSVTVESSDTLDLLHSIRLHGPAASGEVLKVTPCWTSWTADRDPFGETNSAGAEPTGLKLYVGRGQSSYDGRLCLGKASAFLGVACPSRRGESDPRKPQILQNLDQFTWVTVDSHSIADVALQRGVGLMSQGSSFASRQSFTVRRDREMNACRVQFPGWQEDPVFPR